MSQWLKIVAVCRISSSTFGQNWPDLQRGLSAIAELLVYLTQTCWMRPHKTHVYSPRFIWACEVTTHGGLDITRPIINTLLKLVLHWYCNSAVPPLTDESTEEIPWLIILIFCLFGIILLALNIPLIVYFVRRRRKKFDKGTCRFNVVSYFDNTVAS